ncbi:hypothetical protein [Leifsonia poae]|nr:hypothetical protein [Leifsonia poae]
MKPYVTKLLGIQWVVVTAWSVTNHDSHAEAFAAALDRAMISEATA